MITVKSRIKSLRPGEDRFTIQDGLVISPRASIEISNDCPPEYRSIIAQCYNKGWIRPVAHVYGKEITMDSLR